MNEKSDMKDIKTDDDSSAYHVEHIEEPNLHANQIEELSSIEATAASKAAWLISITVSLGGLLFGTYIPSNHWIIY